MLRNPGRLEGNVVVEPVVDPAVEGAEVDGGDLVISNEVLPLRQRPPAALLQYGVKHLLGWADAWQPNLSAMTAPSPHHSEVHALSGMHGNKALLATVPYLP